MAKANSSASRPPSLADLRREIDRIDETMHALLMERGEIIDRLIAVKQTQESGSAFRPAREADMMRRLADRHRGILPLDTAESIWRVMIATFTFVQAPSTLGQITKYRSVSIGRPGPTMVSHQPGFCVTGWILATC